MRTSKSLNAGFIRSTTLDLWAELEAHRDGIAHVPALDPDPMVIDRNDVEELATGPAFGRLTASELRVLDELLTTATLELSFLRRSILGQVTGGSPARRPGQWPENAPLPGKEEFDKETERIRKATREKVERMTPDQVDAFFAGFESGAEDMRRHWTEVTRRGASGDIHSRVRRLPRRIKGDSYDAWECGCGNDTHSSGFEPCDSAGQLVEPDPGWAGLYRCQKCGKIWRHDGYLVGQVADFAQVLHAEAVDYAAQVIRDARDDLGEDLGGGSVRDLLLDRLSWLPPAEVDAMLDELREGENLSA